MGRLQFTHQDGECTDINGTDQAEVEALHRYLLSQNFACRIQDRTSIVFDGPAKFLDVIFAFEKYSGTQILNRPNRG